MAKKGKPAGKKPKDERDYPKVACADCDKVNISVVVGKDNLCRCLECNRKKYPAPIPAAAPVISAPRDEPKEGSTQADLAGKPVDTKGVRHEKLTKVVHCFAAVFFQVRLSEDHYALVRSATPKQARAVMAKKLRPRPKAPDIPEGAFEDDLAKLLRAVRAA